MSILFLYSSHAGATAAVATEICEGMRSGCSLGSSSIFKHLNDDGSEAVYINVERDFSIDHLLHSAANARGIVIGSGTALGQSFSPAMFRALECLKHASIQKKFCTGFVNIRESQCYTKAHADYMLHMLALWALEQGMVWVPETQTGELGLIVSTKKGDHIPDLADEARSHYFGYQYATLV